MKARITKAIFLIFFLTSGVLSFAQNPSESAVELVTILDTFHYSKIFADTRKYRIFLPPSYRSNGKQKYPVIYFFHGWAQRYFGEMGLGYSHYDNGDDNSGDNIESFVKKKDVIVVKVDGSNQFPSEELNLSPWNMSNVTSFRQFPIYFEELVQYIDKHYHTIPDRNHRAVSGLSMGGFMTFWLSGKYPHLISGAGNFCGSLEFEIGPLGFPVEYNHMDMYDNYEGVDLRLHYGTKDRLRYGHQDLNKIWPQVLDNYDYKIYEASHVTCGLGDMFEFLYQRFKDPMPDPETWHHIDVYPNFEIWGYEITSDRIRAGFTILKNVNKKGFSSAVRNYVPDGVAMSEVNLQMITPPIYRINSRYLISDFNATLGTFHVDTIISNSNGNLNIALNGHEHHIGINELYDSPNISVMSLRTENVQWLESGRDINLSIELFNKGQSDATNVDLHLSSARNTVEIKKDKAHLLELKPGILQQKKDAFTIHIPSDTIEIIRLFIRMQDQSGLSWQQHCDLKVRNDENNLEGELMIADGKLLTVVSEAVDSVTQTIGVGNGDGIANPGESIVLLIKHHGKLYRTSAFTSDVDVNPKGSSKRTSDPWDKYDHIGPSAKFTTSMISPRCADGKELRFWVEYWLPKNPEHIIKRGVVTFEVRKSPDQSSPIFRWLQIKNDKKIEIGTDDASKIRRVKIKMTPDEEAASIRHVRWDKPEPFEMELIDDGSAGDNCEGDSVFSGIFRDRASYVYRVEIIITDIYGNHTTHRHDKTIFLQDLE